MASFQYSGNLISGWEEINSLNSFNQFSSISVYGTPKNILLKAFSGFLLL